MTTIASIYNPRGFFRSFHERSQRWAILVAHRRAGKTVAAVNDLIEKATYNSREAPRYAYIAPFLKQAKAIAWEYLKRFAAPFIPKISEAELYVELTVLPNRPRITIYGADNPDSFRGLYFDGVVLDEFGNMAEFIWGQILLPALTDRRGWAVFMGTPNGPNHFRDYWYKFKKDSSWFKLMLRVRDTNILDPTDLEEMRKLMEEGEYAQEMECNFEAAVRGSIYGKSIQQADEDGRIGDFPLDFHTPCDVTLDLGFKDQVSIGFSQRHFDGINLAASHAESFQAIAYYIRYIKAFWAGSAWESNEEPRSPIRQGPKLIRGQVHVPHDAKAKSLQTGKSIIEHFRAAHIRPILVPKLDVIDGIAATRLTFPLLRINEETNQSFILAAKTYHRKWDPDLKRYSDEPVHDWSSDWMDMLRYLCIWCNPKILKKLPRPKAYPVSVPEGGGTSYSFCLNDIWDLTPNSAPWRPYG